jgi:hypothetical protein
MARPPSAVLDDVRYSVHTVQVLPLANESTAKALLLRAVEIGNIILKRHRWTVVKVSEFYPRSKNLLGLNINKGEEIKVRLRYPNDKTRFFAFEEVMCTLLHEIVHCTISPHNAAFWKRYGELVAEAEDILAHSPSSGSSAAAAPTTNAKPKAEGQQPAATIPFSGNGRALGGFPSGPGNRLGGGTSPFATNPGAGSTRPLTEDERREIFLNALLKRNPTLAPQSELGYPFPPGVGDPAPGTGRLTAVAEQRLSQSGSMTARGTGDDDGDETDEGGSCGLQHLLGRDTGEDADESPLVKRRLDGNGSRGKPNAEDVANLDGQAWICPRCQFANSLLLPYCEMCCSDGDALEAPVVAVPPNTPAGGQVVVVSDLNERSVGGADIPAIGDTPDCPIEL